MQQNTMHYLDFSHHGFIYHLQLSCCITDVVLENILVDAAVGGKGKGKPQQLQWGNLDLHELDH